MMGHDANTKELTARVMLPPLVVRLLPSVALERLDEYRSDENIAYLLVGIFAGGALGIISNWVTVVPLTISHSSVVLLLVFLSLTVVFVLWAQRIRQRANLVKKRYLNEDTCFEEVD